MATINRIPDELQIKILGYLTVQDLLKVTRVCRQWHDLVYQGSLWKTIDITPFYKSITPDQLLKIGLAAGNFLKTINFRGCLQLTSQVLQSLSECCVNVESLHLKDCRGISTQSIACFLQNASRLTLLDLSGLDNVKNSTIVVIGGCLPKLEKLNLSWCKNITGEGIHPLKQCHSLKVLKLNGAGLMDDISLSPWADHTSSLDQLSLASCTSLTDSALASLLGHSRLSHLNLSHCTRLTDRTLQHLATIGGDTLTHLELAGCINLTDIGFTFMALRLRSLTVLDLEDLEQITTSAIKTLARTQPHLKRLCLSNCPHIDDGAIEFLVIHGVCTALELLELDECGITDRLLALLATFLWQKNKGSLSTDSGFNEATFKTEPLTLRVLDCGNISESGIRTALDMAGPFLVIKSFYTWRDDHPDDSTLALHTRHNESTGCVIL